MKNINLFRQGSLKHKLFPEIIVISKKKEGVMKNSLINYMNKRLKKGVTFDKGMYKPGPVITISREVGCNGLQMARILSEKLNEFNQLATWNVLSKEIFYESAQELDIDLSKVTKIFRQTDRYTFEEILKAFNNKSYKSERKIINTVIDVVHSHAEDGNCIIVGRAGHIIARDITRSLHIRLMAPLEYRIESIMEKNNMTRLEAIKFIDIVEKERLAFRKAINEVCKATDYFDLTINRASFNDEAIINLTEGAIREKGLLQQVKKKLELF